MITSERIHRLTSAPKIMSTPQDPEATETDQTTSVTSVDLPRLVRPRLGKWLWSPSLDADEWMGCKDSIEETINDALDYMRDMGEITSFYVAPALRIPKNECDELGLDWPWYQVVTENVILITLPNKAIYNKTRHDHSREGRNSENGKKL